MKSIIRYFNLKPTGVVSVLDFVEKTIGVCFERVEELAYATKFGETAIVYRLTTAYNVYRLDILFTETETLIRLVL